MELAQIEQGLAAALARGDSLRRQLVFWYDPAAEFAEAFDELTVPTGVEKLRVASSAPFGAKYRLLVEAPSTSFVVYLPFAEPRPQENWLLDLQTHATPFTADRATMLHQQLRLHDRGLVAYLRAHGGFFGSKKRLAALNAIGIGPKATEAELRLTLMCATVSLKTTDAGEFLRAVLSGGLDPASNRLWAELGKYFAEDEFWLVVRAHLGMQPEPRTLRELFVRLALTHLQHDLPGRLPEPLAHRVMQPSTRAIVLVDQWLRDQRDAPSWAGLSDHVAEYLGIREMAASLHPSEHGRAQVFRAFDEELIRFAIAGLADATAKPSEVLAWVRERVPLYWHARYEPFYAALEAAARFSQATAAIEATWSASPDQLFAAYAARLYQVDQAYRHYVAASDRAESGLLAPLTDAIEREYGHAFLEPIGEAWSTALARSHGTWALEGPPKQWWFYEHYVRPTVDRSEREKVFVIVSDALRYEVAAELRERLRLELRGEPELTAVQGILPSTTPFGMAALLPGAHRGMTLSPDGDVQIDGVSTAGTAGRDAILKRTGVPSLAMPLADLMALNRDEGRELVKAHRVLYLYQNEIDAAGDNTASERTVFAACERAIRDLVAAIKKIANTLNGTQVIVTADHGFQYQRQVLEQKDKVARPSGDLLGSGRRRAALGEALTEPEGTQSFAVPVLRPKALRAQSPRGTLRYALQGAGAQFVHGGASLQETVVPVLVYKHVRADGDDGPTRKVKARVATATRKVTNNHFTLRLVQDEPISARVLQRQVEVRFVDERGEPVTTTASLVLASAAPQATDREHLAHLVVSTSNPDRNATYYLEVVDAEDRDTLLREAWRISLAFTDDFGAL